MSRLSEYEIQGLPDVLEPHLCQALDYLLLDTLDVIVRILQARFRKAAALISACTKCCV